MAVEYDSTRSGESHASEKSSNRDDDYSDKTDSSSAAKTFKSFDVPYWHKRFFLDYEYIQARDKVYDYAFIIPEERPATTWIFHMTPHDFTSHWIKPTFDLPNRAPFYYFHEGSLEDNKNLWLVWESPPELKEKEILPKEFIDLWNSAKIDCFHEYDFIRLNHEPYSQID